MTDKTETHYEMPAEDIRTHNKRLIFAALAEAGITKVSIEFDGAGDSGQIEDILAWNATFSGSVPIPADCKLQLAYPGNPPREATLRDAIETLAYDYLDETYRGWENNDGAFGTFVFDVPARTVTLQHNERYIDVTTSSHEF